MGLKQKQVTSIILAQNTIIMKFAIDMVTSATFDEHPTLLQIQTSTVLRGDDVSTMAQEKRISVCCSANINNVLYTYALLNMCKIACC